MKRLVIVISGRGSNMAAILDAERAGTIAGRVVGVISNRPDAAGLAIAHRHGVPTAIVDHLAFPDRKAFDQALSSAIDAFAPDLVVLAGFMRVLGADFVARYRDRLLNIHPSLLPAYRGLHTHARVLAAGDTEHGASVHFVTGELDAGPVVLQSKVAVQPGDSEATLSARVQATEHIIYPRVLGWCAQRRLAWREGAAWLDGRRLDAPMVEDFRAAARS